MHIEHAITDLDTWLGAFRSFDEARANAGVTAQRVRQPVDDDRDIVVVVHFDSVEAAEAFKGFSEHVVWQDRAMSPGLDGTPAARILEDVALSS